MVTTFLEKNMLQDGTFDTAWQGQILIIVPRNQLS